MGIDPFFPQFRAYRLDGPEFAAPRAPRQKPNGAHYPNRYSNKYNNKKYSPADFGWPLLIKVKTSQ
jgi:hypothetical protein